MQHARLVALLLSTLGLVASSTGQDAPVCGHQTFGKGHPYRMSYGMLKDYIKKSDKRIDLPANLKNSLVDDIVSVGVSFDETGKVTSCGAVVVREIATDKVRAKTPVTGEQVQTILCGHISAWSFRPLLYCGKSVPVSGSVVFLAGGSELELM